MINSSPCSPYMPCGLIMRCALIMLPSVANWVGYRLPNYRTNALFSERSKPISEAKLSIISEAKLSIISDRREHN